MDTATLLKNVDPCIFRKTDIAGSSLKPEGSIVNTGLKQPNNIAIGLNPDWEGHLSLYLQK